MEIEPNLVTALIAAVSAIAGSLISQFLTIYRDWLSKRHSRNVLLREKYEEMANYVVASQQWMTLVTNTKSLEELTSMPPVDARKVVVLTSLYFPKLRESAQDFLNKCVEFKLVLVDNYEFVPGKTLGTQAAHKNKEAFMAAADKYYRSSRNLDDHIVKWARTYAKA